MAGMDLFLLTITLNGKASVMSFMPNNPLAHLVPFISLKALPLRLGSISPTMQMLNSALISIA